MIHSYIAQNVKNGKSEARNRLLPRKIPYLQSPITFAHDLHLFVSSLFVSWFRCCFRSRIETKTIVKSTMPPQNMEKGKSNVRNRLLPCELPYLQSLMTFAHGSRRFVGFSFFYEVNSSPRCCFKGEIKLKTISNDTIPLKMPASIPKRLQTLFP